MSSETNQELVSDIIATDIPKTLALLTEIKDQLSSTTKSADILLQRIKDSESTSKGISFLEAKLHTLLSYLINLTHLVMMKLNGQSIVGVETIERLIEYRVVLERMRPVDQKLKYQIDKLLRMVSSGTVDTNDPLQFRANPENLTNKLENQESSNSEDDDEVNKSNTDKNAVYVPPKLAAVHYDGDEMEQDKQKQMLDRARKKVLSSSIMEDLRKEYYDGPEEIKESVNIQKLKVEKNKKDRIRYEEDNFVRLSVSKKEKNASKKLATMSSLGSLTKFEDISVLDGNSELANTPKKRSKSKGSFQSKKGSKKRRRYH